RIRDITRYDCCAPTRGKVTKEVWPVSKETRVQRRPADNGSSSGANTDSPDKQQVRLTTILTALQQSGSVSVEGLSKDLDVSLVTIRRDLDELERKGLLRRTHGGAISIEPFFYEPFKN